MVVGLVFNYMLNGRTMVVVVFLGYRGCGSFFSNSGNSCMFHSSCGFRVSKLDDLSSGKTILS